MARVVTSELGRRTDYELLYDVDPRTGASIEVFYADDVCSRSPSVRALAGSGGVVGALPAGRPANWSIRYQLRGIPQHHVALDGQVTSITGAHAAFLEPLWNLSRAGPQESRPPRTLAPYASCVVSLDSARNEL